MNTDAFYQVLSGICFALSGLWWTVVESRKEWLKDASMRSLASGVYASFLIPGVMALGAQIGGENKLVWRIVFASAALLGMYFTMRLLAHVQKSGQGRSFVLGRVLVMLVYLVVLVFGMFPELTAPTGLKPIQVVGVSAVYYCAYRARPGVADDDLKS